MAGTGHGLDRIDHMADRRLEAVLTATVRITDHGLASYPPATEFGPRSLTAFHFLWMAGGEAAWIVDGAELALPEGAVVLGRPGMTERFRWDAERQCRHGWIAFTLDPLPPPTALAGWRLVLPGAGAGIVLPLLRHVRRLLGDQPPGHEALAAHALRHCLAVFLAGADGIEAETDDDLPALVEAALDLLAKRWRQGPRTAPPLAWLSRQLSVTPEHLVRTFRRGLGTTPAAAMRALRLDWAARRLGESDLPVQEVARAAGFADPFHFARCFRRQYGCPPTEFRRRMVAGEDLGHVGLVRVRRLADRMWATR
jgi:AraC-like DNA-binding protein